MVIGVTTVTLVYNGGDHVDDLGDRDDDDHDSHDADHDDADNDGRPDGRPIIRAVGPEGSRTSHQISISTTTTTIAPKLQAGCTRGSSQGR